MRAPRKGRREELPDPLVVLQIGDHHLTDLPADADATLRARQAATLADLHAAIAAINAIHNRDAIGFVYLPGDLAENGLAAEYRHLAAALGGLDVPVRLIPGDHDRGLGRMDDFTAFRAALERAGRLPAPAGPTPVEGPLEGDPPRPIHDLFQFHWAEDVQGVRCLFLDSVSAGLGRKGWGLDFRLGSGQLAWLERELVAARGRRVAVFAHCYPADHHEPDEGLEFGSILRSEGVRLVATGHTHYNEVVTDGRTLYSAVRSIGQNEDGPPGFAVMAMDGEAVSWRFRQTQQTWPFVTITQPADRRVATAPLELDTDGRVTVRALVLSDLDPTDPANRCLCACRVDLGIWEPMRRVGFGPMYQAEIPWPRGARQIQVRALDRRFPDFGKDFIDFDTVEPASTDPEVFAASVRPVRPGSDEGAVGSWPIKGIRGDQLGPNKAGRKW